MEIDHAVSGRRNAEGNGDLQTLICVLMVRPRRCLTLSNTVPWQNWMAAYLGYTLRMKTLFRCWPVMVHDTHTRRRSGRKMLRVCRCQQCTECALKSALTKFKTKINLGIGLKRCRSGLGFGSKLKFNQTIKSPVVCVAVRLGRTSRPVVRRVKMTAAQGITWLLTA